MRRAWGENGSSIVVLQGVKRDGFVQLLQMLRTCEGVDTDWQGQTVAV